MSWLSSMSARDAIFAATSVLLATGEARRVDEEREAEDLQEMIERFQQKEIVKLARTKDRGLSSEKMNFEAMEPKAETFIAGATTKLRQALATVLADIKDEFLESMNEDSQNELKALGENALAAIELNRQHCMSEIALKTKIDDVEAASESGR